MRDQGGRSAWFYVGIGCAGLLLVAIVVAGAVIFVGFRSVQRFKDELGDPEARAVRAHRLLGTEKLPDGYHAGVGFSLPFLLDFTMVADRPPQSDGNLARDTERLFIYVKLHRGGRNWDEYIEGDADPMELIEDQGFRFDRHAAVARDELALGETRVVYVAQRGDVKTGDGHEIDGVASFMFIVCPDDDKKRFGIWAGPDPAPDRPVEEVDYSGTVADPVAIRDFLSNFRLCGA